MKALFGELRDQASYLLMISGKHRRDLVSLSSSEQASHVTAKEPASATPILPTCTLVDSFWWHGGSVAGQPGDIQLPLSCPLCLRAIEKKIQQK